MAQLVCCRFPCEVVQGSHHKGLGSLRRVSLNPALHTIPESDDELADFQDDDLLGCLLGNMELDPPPAFAFSFAKPLPPVPVTELFAPIELAATTVSRGTEQQRVKRPRVTTDDSLLQNFLCHETLL